MSNVLAFKKPKKEVNFKIFGQHVAAGELNEAAKVIRDLVECDLEQAERVALHFRCKMEESPNIIMRTMEIRSLLELGEQNKALLAIQEVFGVTGEMSIKFLEVMKEQIQKDLQG